MPLVTIPKTAHKPIRALVDLDEPKFARLLQGLSETSPDLLLARFAERVSGHFDDADQSTIEDIVLELFQVDTTRDRLSVSAGDAAKAIAEAAAEIPDFTSDKQDQLCARLNQVFAAATSLSLSAKAIGVVSDHERIFYNARVLTDIRPVFNEAGNSVEAVAIVHNLVIHFGENSKHRDFHVVLDAEDIGTLRDALDRAMLKANTLQAVIEKTKIAYLSPEE